MLRYFAVICLLILPGLSSAKDIEKYVSGQTIQGPFKTKVIEGGELSFLSTGDIEFPVSLVMDVVKDGKSKKRSLIDKYDVAGSDPKVETVFFYPVRGKPNVLVLVSWELNSRGLGTYGALYQVYAYEQNSQRELVANNIIKHDKRMSGIEGYQEGEEAHFEYKDAASIKAYIIRSIN